MSFTKASKPASNVQQFGPQVAQKVKNFKIFFKIFWIDFKEFLDEYMIKRCFEGQSEES